MGEPRYPYVHVDVPPHEADDAGAMLFDLGAEGVEERDETTLAKNVSAGRVTLVASFALRESAEAAIEAIESLVNGWTTRYDEIIGDAWRDAWKEHFRPFAIAPGLIVRPPWESYTAKDGEKVLVLEPGRAFGTGLHETTRLVARSIAKYGTEVIGKTVLDVGCGSGILSLVALELGAKNAIALDVDPEAIDVTRENADRNGLSDRIDARDTPIEEEEAIVPVVLANIEARVLIPMAEELARHVSKGGLLFLSGILVTQKEDVHAAYAEMDLLEAPSLGEWTLLAFRKR